MIRIHDHAAGEGRVPHLQEWISLVGDEQVMGDGNQWACVITFPNQTAEQTKAMVAKIAFSAQGDQGNCQVGAATFVCDFDSSKRPASKPAQRPRPALVQVKEDPNLPRVLLIGDSISMGYTLPLRELLKGKANLQHPTENCLSSRNIVAKLDRYLGNHPWDVVVFNAGIHDLTYRDAKRNFLKPEDGGKIDVPLDEYQENLEKIVARLQKTGAKLIWCSTSPVSDHVGHRLPADVIKYNAAADAMMIKHKIQVIDPHQELAKRGQLKLTSDGVHFTRLGYREIAGQLSETILNVLPSRIK